MQALWHITDVIKKLYDESYITELHQNSEDHKVDAVQGVDGNKIIVFYSLFYLYIH